MSTWYIISIWLLWKVLRCAIRDENFHILDIKVKHSNNTWVNAGVHLYVKNPIWSYTSACWITVIAISKAWPRIFLLLQDKHVCRGYKSSVGLQKQRDIPPWHMAEGTDNQERSMETPTWTSVLRMAPFVFNIFIGYNYRGEGKLCWGKKVSKFWGH